MSRRTKKWETQKEWALCPVSYTHLDVYKRQDDGRCYGMRYFDRLRKQEGRTKRRDNRLSLIHI